MVLNVRIVGVVDREFQPLAAADIDGNRQRRVAAADDWTRVFLLTIDRHAELNATLSCRQIVDGDLGLETRR